MTYKHWNEGGQSGSKDDLLNRPVLVEILNQIDHELSIKFKFPYVNDELTYNDISDKSKGYILKDGGYSKKLRIHSLKKPQVNGKEMLPDQQTRQEFL